MNNVELTSVVRESRAALRASAKHIRYSPEPPNAFRNSL